MAEPALPPAPVFPALDSSIGAFLVGTILSVFLAGITSVQAFEYFTTFGKTDRKLLVGVVSVLVVIDLFHTAISCYTIYLWTVTHYGDLSSLINSPWSFTWDPFLTGVVTIIVQIFYAWRVFVVSRNKWLIPAVISVLSLLQFAFATGSTWMIYRLDSKFARFGEFRYGVAIWLLSAAVADILITGSLIFYLRRATKNDYQTSSPIVERIIRVTIETNGLTCIFAIVDAVLFVAMPKDSWHVLPNLSLVKLYFNGLLVSLNSRKALQVAAAQGRGRDDADDKNGGTPYGTPAPRYTATFGSVPNPQSQMHGCTTLSIAVRNVKHVEESQLDEDEGMHPDANGQYELHSVASRDVPAPPPHIYAVSTPQATAVRSQQQEQALKSGAVRQEWQ
ncbi:DUF6534 domain-containing protein [Rhodotorula paludigena]|uniref:DUF6534 domain-containing protein n=1 Tax=Rhodotorula paludigena TaxID=86838 RepID=UPI003174B9E4